MKKLLLLAVMAISTISQAQYNRTPYATVSKGPELYSQMGNFASTYFNTSVGSLTSRWGTLLDTITDAGTLTVGTAKTAGTAVTLKDTALPAPLLGDGTLTLTAYVWKCTGTCTVTVTPVESSDGVRYAQIPGTTVATVNPTSLTVPTVSKFNLTTKPDRFIGFLFTGAGTQTVSVQGFYDFNKKFIYSPNSGW